MIGQLSQLLRLSLRTSHAQEVPLRDELEVLDCYLGLMRARLGNRLHATVHADPDVLDTLVPSLVLQPLVENAISHGNASHASGGRVTVRASRTGDSVKLDVADDGPGAPLGTDVFGKGVGLSATRDRVRLLYGAAQEFDARNRDGGFAVTITLPYRRSSSALATPDAELVNVDAVEKSVVAAS